MPRGSDTRDRILDVAQELMQTRGYHAISFDDIAPRVGIKKPSIVHHFPTKAALGAAVIERYRVVFGGLLEAVANDPTKSNIDALNLYFTPYLDFGSTDDKICLCGALAGEFMALPDSMRTEVRRFFGLHLTWLEDILERGKQAGEFVFDEPPGERAALILDAAQGALLVRRATGRKSHLIQTIGSLKSQLIP